MAHRACDGEKSAAPFFDARPQSRRRAYNATTNAEALPVTHSRRNAKLRICLGLAGLVAVVGSVSCVLSGARRQPTSAPTAYQLAPSRTIRTPLSPLGLTPTRLEPGTLRLEGQVVDSELRPLADAEVAIDDTERATTSAADGSFALERLAAGHMARVVVKPDGSVRTSFPFNSKSPTR